MCSSSGEGSGAADTGTLAGRVHLLSQYDIRASLLGQWPRPGRVLSSRFVPANAARGNTEHGTQGRTLRNRPYGSHTTNKGDENDNSHRRVSPLRRPSPPPRPCSFSLRIRKLGVKRFKRMGAQTQVRGYDKHRHFAECQVTARYSPPPRPFASSSCQTRMQLLSTSFRT